MKFPFLKLTFVFLLVACYSCNNDDESNNDQTDEVSREDVVENYANIVYQSYKDALDLTKEMQTDIQTFTANPTEDGLNDVKADWLAAREPYGQTEAYREAGGPIDSDIEGRINAWPLDENYVDYVRDANGGFTTDGIINDSSITIDKTTLSNLNENGDKNISSGWHAIEFLLWGQDFSDPSNGLAGQRPYTDYITDGSGTAQNQERRALYLNVVTEVLIDDLQSLVDAWAPSGTYRTTFLSLSKEDAIKNMLSGIFFMSGEELSNERMAVAVDTDQEDEHSCFSDNTHRDIVTNALGIDNVVFGRYGSISGASFFDLVEETDETQAERLRAAAEDAQQKVAVINTAALNGKPFDIQISEEQIDSGGPIMAAVLSLKALSAEISASAAAIGIPL